MFKAIKWYDRSVRVWYAGVEDADGSLVDLAQFPGFDWARGQTGIDSPTRSDAENDVRALARAIRERNEL